MKYKLSSFGHPNILATHKTTFEFTKDKEVSLKGDCIIGVKADFKLSKVKDFIKKINNNKITITIKAKNKKQKIQETISAELNPNFNSNKELVIRKTNFASERTFAVKADKSAFDLNRGLIAFLREKKNKIDIIIENKKE